MPTMKMRNIFCLCCLALVAGYLPAQNTERTQPNTVDTRIQRAVAAVSADRLQASDLALVNFGTRHTLGTNLPPEKKAGVVQAQEWLTAQLQRLAAQCQGCLEVQDTYLHRRALCAHPTAYKAGNCVRRTKGLGRRGLQARDSDLRAL